MDVLLAENLVILGAPVGGRGVGVPAGVLVLVGVGAGLVELAAGACVLVAVACVLVAVLVGGTQICSKVYTGGGLAELVVPSPQIQPSTLPLLTWVLDAP